jgi:hypothetical protein
VENFGKVMLRDSLQLFSSSEMVSLFISERGITFMVFPKSSRFSTENGLVFHRFRGEPVRKGGR